MILRPHKLFLHGPRCLAAWLYAFAATACTLLPCGAFAQTLHTLKEIHRLTNTEAESALPAELDATVTYYRVSNRDLFVQDGDSAIFVHFQAALHVVPGDRV